MNVLELKDVTKTYRIGEEDVKVLQNVNIKIRKGSFIAIIGPSGSGKSTLLNMIGALDRPTEGKIYINEKDISKLTDDQIAKIRGYEIGFVFQSFNLIPRISALENVNLPSWFSEKKSNGSKILDKVGLSHRKHNYPAKLSGGERQRVAIARALINNPNIIIADEPTGNLDSVTGNKIMKMFTDINKEGKTVILVTHDMNIAKKSPKRIYIKDGKIVNRL